MTKIDQFLNKKRPSIETIKEKANSAETNTETEKPTDNKKKMVLSPSTLSLFMECPRCFWLAKIRKIKRPSVPFPSLPNGMDRILKQHFDMHRKQGMPPEELENKFVGVLFHDMDKLNAWRNHFKGLRYTDPNSGVELMGAIDDLFVTSDGKVAPLDFKTRGFPRGNSSHTYYQHQMDLYSLLLEKNGLKPADFAILIFYHPVGVNKTHDVIFDPDPVKLPVDRKRAETIFLDAVKCIQRSEPPEPNPECEWCKWNK
jgi:hypothetical protein